MTQYQPKTMLVTGGAGFIGCNFIRHVLKHESNINIINVDKLTYAGSIENLEQLPHSERYHFIQADIADAQAMQTIFLNYEIDTVVHCAAETHVDRSILAPANFVNSNIVGTFVLLQTALHHWFELAKKDAHSCRFHYISTDEVHGELEINESAFTESSALKPRSPYSASKAAGEHLVNAYYHTYGLPITLSRCSNNYGPYQHEEKFIPTVIKSCLQLKAIPVYGLGKNIRDWLYVEDHCRGILATIKQGQVGQSYNFGANNEWQNLDLVNYICKTMDQLLPRAQKYASLIQFVSDRPGHDFRYAINNNKVKNELNWQPQTDWQSGIQQTISFYSCLKEK